MPAEVDLYNALSGDAGVAAIVGERIYSDLPNEEVSPPYIYFERINTEMINTIHTGIPAAQFSDFVVVCFATTRVAAEGLADTAMLATATGGTFVLTGRQGEYDGETRLFAATIQLQHNF